MPRVFLIDTDTASDDAVALVMALTSPDVRVAAITVVAGNVGVDQACRNALYTAELCGSDVPVYRGADSPLIRPLEDATWFHGQDGLGDRGYPAPQRSIDPIYAPDAIIATAEANPGLTVVTLGPLTNLALASKRKPGLAKLISRCVVMGGNPCCEGNVTPAAEFNIWCDPEAAHIVMRAGLPIELVGWQLCRWDAALSLTDISHVQSIGTPLANFAIDCNSTAQAAYLEQTGEHGISLPDPIAMAIALDPSISTSSTKHFVDVEVSSPLTRGMTVVDRLSISKNDRNRMIWQELVSKPENTLVHWSIDIPRWKALLYQRLSTGQRDSRIIE